MFVAERLHLHFREKEWVKGKESLQSANRGGSEEVLEWKRIKIDASVKCKTVKKSCKKLK
jgi:hypothetical protein